MKVSFTGHRPDKIGGYDENNALRIQIKQDIRYFLRGQLNETPDLTVLVGGALGVDTDVARECWRLGIPYILCAPCRNQDARWNNTSRATYRTMSELASEIIYVYDGDYKTSQCLFDRNQYMVDNSDKLVAVWNGDKFGGTWSCMSYAKRVNKPITYIKAELGDKNESME